MIGMDDGYACLPGRKHRLCDRGRDTAGTCPIRTKKSREIPALECDHPSCEKRRIGYPREFVRSHPRIRRSGNVSRETPRSIEARLKARHSRGEFHIPLRKRYRLNDPYGRIPMIRIRPAENIRYAGGFTDTVQEASWALFHCTSSLCKNLVIYGFSPRSIPPFFDLSFFRSSLYLEHPIFFPFLFRRILRGIVPLDTSYFSDTIYNIHYPLL